MVGIVRYSINTSSTEYFFHLNGKIHYILNTNGYGSSSTACGMTKFSNLRYLKLDQIADALERTFLAEGN